MKKNLFKLMALAIAAMTFAACEDVPAPYDFPSSGDDNGQGGGTTTVTPVGTGTQADPFNVAAAIEKCKVIGDVEPSEKFYVKGIVESTTAADDTYGNATFDIVDVDGGDKFKCFQVAGTDGKKLPKGFVVNQGDEVVVYGPIYNYRGNTPETAGKGAAYIVTVNGKSTDGGDAPSGEIIGTIDNPQTVAQALVVINGLGDDEATSELYYVKGKIKTIKTTADNIAKYKNIDYVITDDGQNELTVFRGKNLNNTDFTQAGQINVGDEVVVLGNLQKYVNPNTGAVVPEMAQGNYIVKLTAGSNTPDTPTNTGTKESPLTASQAYDAVAAMEAGVTSTVDFYVKGKVTSIKYTFSAKYGTATFNISDDGKASDKEFIAYSCYYLGNKSWTEGDTQIAEGDEVIVCGKVINYMGDTPEFASKQNYLISLNGATASQGENPGGGGEVSGNSLEVTYGSLGISSLDSPITLTDGTTLTFAQEDGNNTPVYHASTSIIRMYARNSVTINAGSKTIASVVFHYDTYNGTAYKGNDEMYGEAGGNRITPTKDDKNVTFSNVNSSTLKVVNAFAEKNSGGTQFRCTGLTINYAE